MRDSSLLVDTRQTALGRHLRIEDEGRGALRRLEPVLSQGAGGAARAAACAVAGERQAHIQPTGRAGQPATRA